MSPEVRIEDAQIAEAQQQGVLTMQEAFALEHLEDETVPDWLCDAVERLYLWFAETEAPKH